MTLNCVHVLKIWLFYQDLWHILGRKEEYDRKYRLWTTHIIGFVNFSCGSSKMFLTFQPLIQNHLGDTRANFETKRNQTVSIFLCDIQASLFEKYYVENVNFLLSFSGETVINFNNIFFKERHHLRIGRARFFAWIYLARHVLPMCCETRHTTCKSFIVCKRTSHPPNMISYGYVADSSQMIFNKVDEVNVDTSSFVELSSQWIYH